MTKLLVAFFLCILAMKSYASDFIPPQAFNFRSTIQNEIDRFYPELYRLNYIPALIEHESCITLRHRRCWSPTSRLKSAREEGAGLGQLTRAFRADGSIRFDMLTEMRNRYRNELRELSWDNVYVRPDLQIRTIILMVRDLERQFFNVPNRLHRLHMMNAAYNGGTRDVQRERRQCGLAANCDPNIWFGHVELHCVKSRKPLYGNRSACDINRHHARSVFINRLPKYERLAFLPYRQ